MKYRTAKKILRCRPMRGGGVRLSLYRRRTIHAAQDAACRRNKRINRRLMARIRAAIAEWDRANGARLDEASK